MKKLVSGMSEVRGWGAFAGPERGGALRRTSVFRRENLDAGRIQFARADEGQGPRRPWPAGASAGTQAEDALTMKRLYQAACG